jgi:hypothetical protein
MESFPKLEEVTAQDSWTVELLRSVVSAAVPLKQAFEINDPDPKATQEFISEGMLSVTPELMHLWEPTEPMAPTALDVGSLESANCAVDWVDFSVYTELDPSLRQHPYDIHMLATRNPERAYVVPYLIRTEEDMSLFRQLEERILFPSNWIEIPIMENGHSGVGRCVHTE